MQADPPTPSELYQALQWPFGEQFLGGRHFLARLERRPFAILETPGGSYQFFARTDRWNPAEVWTTVVFAPPGRPQLDLPVIFRRRESSIGHGLETVEVALATIAAHLAAGQPLEWEDADLETEDESADED
ncbi:MAG: hypothetical protein K6U89_03870 [Chloroflexi bacterium]|nr:hypothetical protein [Chloroflexota bacterium]GIW11103.1 MAG: hypothetical protein KatS3mg061_2160 [Dehalococcoidia bacterium]